ncbi:MAG: hypothetical protein HY057_04050 [Rhodospirillales bacterium]|nr:hypothetical protein [Rhodospirillales bacterium]
MADAAGSLIATTPMNGLRHLGAQGQPVNHSHAQLVSVVRARLGPRHAAFFATPAAHGNGDKIDWFAPVDGPTTNWATASRAQQEQIAVAVAALLSGFAKLRADLAAADPAGPGALMAEIIGRALVVEHESAMFLIGDQPVAILWGLYSSGAAETPSVLPVLRERIDRPAPPPAPLPARPAFVPPPMPPTGPPPTRTDWRQTILGTDWLGWLWRILAVLVALLALILLLRTCTEPRGPVLRVPTDGPAAPTSPETAPAEPATPEPAPTLTVPPGAAESGDLGFLEGRWRSTTDLYNSQTKQPLVAEYEFDAKGNGQTAIAEADTGQTCKGRTVARFDGPRRLVIEEIDRPSCPLGGGYQRSRIVCDIAAGGEAICKGQQGDGHTFSVILRR